MAGPDAYEDDAPYAQYDFEIEIDGGPMAGFSEVTGLAKQVETMTYQEGGVNGYVHEFPEKSVHANLVLKRGFTDNTKFWNWIQNVMGGQVQRKDIIIKMKSRQTEKEGWGWEVYNAYPIKWVGPELTGQQSGIAFEAIEFTYERFSGLSGMPEQ